MELNTFTMEDFVSLTDFIWLDNVEGADKSAINSGIFIQVDIPQNTGNTRQFSEIQREQYLSIKDEGDQADRLKYQQGYSKTMTKKRMAKDVGITYEDINENKYPDVIAKLTDMAEMPWNTVELDLQMRLSYFDATSYEDKDGVTVDTTVGDTLAWGSTAHTVRASSATFRNILANNPRLSKGSLITMGRLSKENAIDQFGKKIQGIRYDILWTTDDEEDIVIASEILESMGAIDYTNPAITNVMRYKYRHVVLPRVAIDATGAVDTTKRHYWGVVSSRYATAYLGWWERPHKIPLYEKKDGTDNYETGVRVGYGVCVVSGRGANFSKGNGDA